MNKVKIFTTAKDFYLNMPENWEELSANQFCHIAHIILKTEEQMPAADKQVRVLAILAGKSLPVILKLEDDVIYELLPLTEWVFNTKAVRSLGKDFIRRSHGKNFYPPASFETFRFGEWCHADTYLMQFLSWNDGSHIHARDEKLLNLFIAAIVRPAGKGKEFIPGKAEYRGDPRERFNANNVDARAEKEIAKLDAAYKSGLALWFLTQREISAGTYDEVFPSAPGEVQTGRNYGWLGIFDELSGEKGRTPAMLEDELIDNVFLTLQRNNEKAQAIKEKYE